VLLSFVLLLLIFKYDYLDYGIYLYFVLVFIWQISHFCLVQLHFFI